MYKITTAALQAVKYLYNKAHRLNIFSRFVYFYGTFHFKFAVIMLLRIFSVESITHIVMASESKLDKEVSKLFITCPGIASFVEMVSPFRNLLNDYMFLT